MHALICSMKTMGLHTLLLQAIRIHSTTYVAFNNTYMRKPAILTLCFENNMNLKIALALGFEARDICAKGIVYLNGLDYSELFTLIEAVQFFISII